jgi:hypothetical protein
MSQEPLDTLTEIYEDALRTAYQLEPEKVREWIESGCFQQWFKEVLEAEDEKK